MRILYAAALIVATVHLAVAQEPNLPPLTADAAREWADFLREHQQRILNEVPQCLLATDCMEGDVPVYVCRRNGFCFCICVPESSPPLEWEGDQTIKDLLRSPMLPQNPYWHDSAKRLAELYWKE